MNREKEMTVADLRKALEGLDGDMPVIGEFYDEEGDDAGIGGLATATVESRCSDTASLFLEIRADVGGVRDEDDDEDQEDNDPRKDFPVKSFFVSLDQDGKIKWHGQVLHRIVSGDNSSFTVELFPLVKGTQWTVGIEEMKSWKFFDTLEEMWVEHDKIQKGEDA